MLLFQAVEVDGEKQVRRRLEQVELLIEKQSIRAQRNEPLLCNEALDDLTDLAMDQRLAARDGNHRRSAFRSRVQAFLHRKTPVEDGIGIVDLAAARARQIAPEQGFQHENQRIPLAAHKLLLEKIGTHPSFHEKRQHHSNAPIHQTRYLR